MSELTASLELKRQRFVQQQEQRRLEQEERKQLLRVPPAPTPASTQSEESSETAGRRLNRVPSTSNEVMLI